MDQQSSPVVVPNPGKKKLRPRNVVTEEEHDIREYDRLERKLSLKRLGSKLGIKISPRGQQVKVSPRGQRVKTGFQGLEIKSPGSTPTNQLQSFHVSQGTDDEVAVSKPQNVLIKSVLSANQERSAVSSTPPLDQPKSTLRIAKRLGSQGEVLQDFQSSVVASNSENVFHSPSMSMSNTPRGTPRENLGDTSLKMKSPDSEGRVENKSGAFDHLVKRMSSRGFTLKFGVNSDSCSDPKSSRLVDGSPLSAVTTAPKLGPTSDSRSEVKSMSTTTVDEDRNSAKKVGFNMSLSIMEATAPGPKNDEVTKGVYGVQKFLNTSVSPRGHVNSNVMTPRKKNMGSIVIYDTPNLGDHSSSGGTSSNSTGDLGESRSGSIFKPLNVSSSNFTENLGDSRSGSIFKPLNVSFGPETAANDTNEDNALDLNSSKKSDRLLRHLTECMTVVVEDGLDSEDSVETRALVSRKSLYDVMDAIYSEDVEDVEK